MLCVYAWESVFGKGLKQSARDKSSFINEIYIAVAVRGLSDTLLENDTIRFVPNTFTLKDEMIQV